MPLNESIYRRKQREEEERRRREQAVEIARGGSNNSATSPQTNRNYNPTNSSTSSQNSSYGSQTGSQTVSQPSTPAERDLFKITGRKFTDRLDRATARDNGTGNTNKTRTLDRTNEKTYSRYDTEGTEKSNIRKNYLKDRAEFRKEHPVGRWLGAEGNNALWGLDAELAKGVDFFLPGVITPKKVQQGLDYYKKQGEEAQKTVEKERGGSVERTILGTVGGESLKNIPSATMAYLSGGASLGTQVAGKAVPSLYKASELTHVGNTFTRALNEVAQTTGKNPMFWETFARTIGTTYEKEIENGADPVRATMSAYTNALLNAQIEVGGGIEVYDPSEDFLKAVARSAKEEGLEEVEQYAVENLVNKAMGSNTARWLSLTRGQDAVINPVDMAEQGFYGALSGGLMSGGRTALANARTEAIDSALNPVSAEAVQQGMADQQGLVNRGLVQERADEDGEQISTKAKSLAQDLQAQLDRGEALQPNQVKRLIREINKESNANEQNLERARVREVGKSLDEGSFVEETGLDLEQQISKQKDSALESRTKEKVKAILGENASDNEVASVTKVVIGTANSRDIDTVLTKPTLKNAVADMVNEGADADSKIQIPINNVEARTALENLTAVKGIANRNAILKETQEENDEDIKALLTNLNSGGKDLFANHLAEGSNAIGDVYQNRFYRMYNEGRKDGEDFEEAYDRLIAPLGSDVQGVFTRDFAQQIFAQGKASLATDNAKATAKSLAEKYANRSSGVTYENNDDSIISEAEKKGLETLAKAGNVEIRVMKNLTATDKDGKALLTKDGKELMVNGMYKDGTIYISANTKNKLITVAKHELTHYIKEMSPERYKELEDFVLKKWYKNDPVAMAKRIEEYQRLYKDATPEEAREELIADASEAFFTDEATIEEAVSFSKKLGKAIHDGIKHILDAFTGDTRGYRGYGDFMKDLGILQEAERMWLEALEDTQQRKRNAKGGIQTEATTESEAKLSVTAEEDQAYMDAVNKGDMKTAQRMVDEQAKRNGYNIKVFHGTPNETISASRGRVRGDDYKKLATDYADKLFPYVVFRNNGRLTGIYTSTDRGIADAFSYSFSRQGTVYDLYARADKPFTFDAEGNGWNNIPISVVEDLDISKAGRTTLEDVSRSAKEQGYDAVVVNNVRETGSGDNESPLTTDVIVFNSTQLKSADPVTYDNKGDVIPLSQRFNENNDDIRWSVTTENEPLPKGGKIPKSMEKWAKKVGLETLSKQDSKVPVNVSVRSLRSYWYAMNGRTDEARTVNNSLRSVADALQKLSVKYKYIGLDDAMNATVHYRTDEKGRPTSVYLTCQVKNAEYEINYDFTTICAKRAPLQKVLERFIKTEGERMDTLYDELKLDEEGMYKLRLILEQAGFEVSCIACFVEQNRYSQQAQAETVATDWNKALDEWATENGTRATEHFDLANLDLKSIPFEEIKKGFTNYYKLMRDWKTAHPKESANVAVKNRMLIEAIPYFRKRMNPSEYASIDGQRALMAMGNKKTNLYNLLKRGQGYAKQSVPFVAYNGEVALLPDRVKNKSLFNYLMSIGGARAQSASDFQIEYVFDYMQMVADLSARRLPMHMYTKVIELAELFGKTGIKINLSAMCAVDNSVDSEYAGLKKVNGRWVYNISDQSIDYNKAVKLQRQEGYSKNIGIIMVTLSKYHMLKALGDKDVRYIIGYHSSKMPAVVSKASDMESAMDCTKINKTNRLNDKGRELFDRAMSIAKGDTELERYKNALRIFDDMIQKEVSKEKADKRPRRGNEYSRYMTGFKANTADFDVYNDIKSTKDPRKTADNYIQYCMDNDLIPMYFPFAFHENYYKCEVYDFNMFDNNTGEYAPMEAVQNIYPDLDMTKGETDTTKFMGRVSKYMNEQNKKNKALEPKYQEVERRAKETLRIDIDGNDHMDMDAMEIDPNEYKHRADVLTDIRDGKASVSEVEDSEYGRLQKENETLKEAVWERNEQISVERMRAEMDVQRERRRGTERKRKAVNETRERYEARINDLKEQQKERERKAKERREEAERRDKEHRKQVHERASARRRASEERARQERQEQREARRERKQDSEARTRLLNIARRLDRIKGTDEFNRIRDQLIGNLDLEAKSMTGKTKMKLEDLEKWYQDQVENNDWFVKNERLEKKFERLRKTHISDMSLEDVQNLTEILLMLEHKVRNDKKLINSQYKKDVFMASFETAEGIKQSKGLKFKGLHKVDNIFIGQVLSPIRYMRRLTGYDEDNPLMIATRELQKGEIASLDYRRRALEPFLKFTDMKFTSYLNGNKAPEIEVNATTIDMKPTTVKITPAIRIWFYLSSMNADNMRHIVNGGVRIPDVKLLKKGKRTDAYDNGTLVRFSKSQVQAIIDGMTSKEEAYAKAVFNYFNKVAPEATNAVSETLDGISIAKVKNYVPIHVDDTFLDVEGDTIKMDGTVEGMGSHKERVQSSKPAYAEDVSDLLMRSIDADMKYVGMAIPLRNFGKIYRSSSMESARGQAEHIELTGETNNSPSTLVYGDEQTATYRTRTGGYVSVRDAIRSLWTSDATKYIDKFLSDLQFPRSQVGEVERTLRELTSNYAGAVLTLNASVAIKQSASYPTAGAVLGWKPLIKAFTKVGKLDLDYANSVTPLLAYRAEGFNFREAGDIQNRDGRDSWFKRIMRTPLFNWIQGMDLLTTRKLFKASEIYVQDKYHLKRGQSGYDEKVAEIFNKVITETQPNYTVMERAGHLRSDSTLERTLSMFKTQPYQNFNIWYDATGDYLDKRDAYKKAKTKANREALKEASVNLGNATTSQIAQLAVFAVMTSLWALARGKDDKWRDEEGNLSFASYLKQLAHDMIGGVASEFFLGSDVFSALDSVINDSYYSGFSSVTDSSINDFFNTGMDMTKLLQQAWDYAVKGNEEEIDTDKLLKQMEKVVTEGGRFSGIPTGNLINLKNLMYRWVCVSKDGEYIGEYEALKASFAKDSYKKDILKRAYRNDKKAYEELRQMMIDDGMSESTLDKYINDSARENPTEEQTNSYKRSLTFLEGNRLWYNNDSVYIEDYDNALRDIALGIDTDDTDRLKKLESVGISPEENVLIRLAMEKADILYGDKNGTLNKDEKLRALDMVRSSLTLTEKEKEEILKTSFSFGKGKKKS